MSLQLELFTPDLSDFGPEEPFDAPFPVISFAGLYALFDEHDECLYIGQSVSVPARIPQHRQKSWFRRVATRRTLELKDEEARLIREAVLCLALRPCKNRTIKLAKPKHGTCHELSWVGTVNKYKRNTTTPRKS